MSSSTPSQPQALSPTQPAQPTPRTPPPQQQLAIPMERRDTGASRTSTGSSSTSAKRVSFLSQPSVEVKRYGGGGGSSSRGGSRGGKLSFLSSTSIVRQVFILFVLLALLLSVWYLVTSVILKPVKEILLEELGSDGAEELLEASQNGRGNMTEIFSHALSDLLGSDGNRTQPFNGSYVI